jgi:ribA/ribD-fused uncharacterized protein
MTAAAFITSDGETRGCASGISLSVPQDNRILFYQRDRWEFGFLSHFYPSRMTIDGVDWPTVEHYYQSHKSLDRRYFLAIRACETPGLAKRRAATPVPGKKDRGSWFVEKRQMPRPDWAEVKACVMRRGDTEKYLQNQELAAMLLATGGAEIVEDSANDAYWGIGPDGAGANMAGRILMEVRDALRLNLGAARVAP